ncbi:DUF3019 domain-containing protein [Litorilituus lipolyticus]|uniref:DUF3019 domain-containing protein n=1 Tax=Litorilituus lipolyticus TaxID=2491017 RepID=A0A502L2E9_9GAMM|nr:DUF3019 domain-containing protein [Litorilituus lipolyticus]TPH14567.1 DUF3019 domain-containing protein [Litorilituus lipolyticus]
MKLLLTILISTIALYFSQINKVKADDPLLSISPESCMAKEGWCKTSLEISWKLIKPQNVCINIESQDKAYCFRQSLEQSKVIAISVNQPIKVYLTSLTSNKIIATAKMNVLMQEHKTRKRQRHAWSILR